VSVGRVVSAERGLVSRTAAERREAEALLADATARRDQAELQMHQMDALRVVIQADVFRLNRAAADAHAAATLEAAIAALALARAHGTIYPAVDGPVFTPDSDLTKPSGLTVERIERFLHGTALAGLGKAYMETEARYHVSANYLVADSILESAWGTSRTTATPTRTRSGSPPSPPASTPSPATWPSTTSTPGAATTTGRPCGG